MKRVIHNMSKFDRESLPRFDNIQFYKLPPPLDKTWINGIRAESKDAIQMFRARCPDIWKSS